MRTTRSALLGAVATLAGILLSGPVGMLIARLHPQPTWRGPGPFVEAFHPVQTVPYFAGFLLVSGSVFLIAALKELVGPEHAARANAALVFAAAFASLIFLNYVLQTTVVPMLVRAHAAENGPLLSLLTMSNPKSLAWALEMWGYGALGAATWLVAPAFQGSRWERVTAWLFVANGPMSIVGAVWMGIDPGWVMGPVGLSMFILWNLLMIAMTASAIVVLRRRLRGESSPTRPGRMSLNANQAV